MTLQVFSTRMGLRDPDALDVTRKTGREGLFLAPSWDILKPALKAREEAQHVLRLHTGGIEPRRQAAHEEAETILAQAWSAYVPAFVAEMRRSYVTNRAAWDALLARPRVVLLCYCTDAERCHRRILRVDILPKLGAVDAGELPATLRRASGRSSR